jgi:ribonuclease HII
MTLQGGIDEAGRGCIAGPLVVAGVSIRDENLELLTEIGVRDSKKLSPRRRETLYGEILKISERVFSTQIQPPEIDRIVLTGKKYRKLNYLEAIYFAKVADNLGADHVTVDASDSSPERFRSNISDHLSCVCEVEAHHKADRDYPVVSAASIIAKVERDREVLRLRERHGDFGSGYPSDPRTRIFFTERLRRGEPLPDYVRKSWKTWRKLEQNLLAPF